MSRCIFSRIQDGFDTDDIAALNTLLASKGHLDIAREMTSVGHPMSEHTVRRHKKHDCMCNRVAA
jgi:hypothetical protein